MLANTCSGDVKVWWFVVLARGKVHIEVMPESWRQNGEGQAFMVSRLPQVLSALFGESAPKPSVSFTDRGPGFYHPSTGNICPAYLAALKAYGFSPWAGEHALWQPQTCQTFCYMKQWLHGFASTSSNIH